jgi:hypothetical protein
MSRDLEYWKADDPVADVLDYRRAVSDTFVFFHIQDHVTLLDL